MSAAPKSRACERFDRWIGAYVDEELDAVHCLEVEDHLVDCADCSELVATLQATRFSLRAVCAVKAPSSLRDRVSRTLQVELAAEREEQTWLEDRPSADRHATPRHSSVDLDTGTSVRPPPAQLVRLRFVVPLAAAATLALVFGAMRLKEAEEGATPEKVAAADSASVDPMIYSAATLEGLLEDLVAQHAHPPPPETTDPEGVRRFDPFIGVRVKTPRFDSIEATYVGARMHQRAALLQYVVRQQHRVTMYVFDPRRVPVRPRAKLEERQYGARNVYVGHIRGYAVAASEQNGVGYALASDLSDDEAARLVLMAAR